MAAPDRLLANATILDPAGLRAGLDVLIHAGVIGRVEPAGSVDRGGAVVTDCTGLLLVPSFANVHHHFYSALLRGAPPAPPARHQRERLERVVWPFERRLTQDDVRVAVRLGLLEATLAGTTAVVDHHVSAGCIPSVLDILAEEVAASGLRAVLCYEVTDRDGPTVAQAGLAETERFLRGPRRGHLRGMVGLHAMSTVGPATLAAATDLARRFGVGVHLHLGESPHDNEDSVARFGARPVARLAAAGGLGSHTLAAHCVHVTDDEVMVLAEHDVLVAHNPRSNASNGVGVPDLGRLRRAGLVVGVGGDGFSQDVRAELDLAALLQRQAARDPRLMAPPDVIAIGVDGNATIVQRLGGWRTGRVEPGFQADLVALAYDPIVPLVPHNALWHLARGLPSAITRHVWVGGEPILHHGAAIRLDAERIRHDARSGLNAIWSR